MCQDDKNLTLKYVSEGFLSMIGYTQEQLFEECGNSLVKLVVPEDFQRTLSEVQEQMSTGDKKIIEYRLIRRDGSVIWVLDRGQYVQEDDGFGAYCCIVVDITEKVVAGQKLTENLERQEIIMEQTNDIIFEWSPAGELTMTANWGKLFGDVPKSCGRFYDNDFVVNECRVHPEDAGVLIKNMSLRQESGDKLPNVDVRLRKRDGSYVWCQVRISIQMGPDGNPLRYIGLIRDIDIEKRLSMRLQREAERDPLTGLYNRKTAKEMIEMCLIKDKDTPHILMIVDLDNFKYFNDTRGHLYGDAVLKNFADSLKKIFRNNDVVSRFGGDEFTVFLNRTTSREDAFKCSDKILQAFRELRVNDGTDGQIFSCSIGISCFPADGKNYEDLFKAADIALYRAKGRGKNCVELFCDGSGILTTQSKTFTAIDKNEQNYNEVELNFIRDVFNLFYEAKDIDKVIRVFMEIIGRQYGVSRVYIFETSEDSRSFSGTYEWCREEIMSVRDRFQNQSRDVYGDFFGNFDAKGVFYCRDTDKLDEPLRSVMRGQGVLSSLQCRLMDGDRTMGVLALDECLEPRDWEPGQIETVNHCSHIISAYLSKLRLQEKLTAMLSNVNEI